MHYEQYELPFMRELETIPLVESVLAPDNEIAEAMFPPVPKDHPEFPFGTTLFREPAPGSGKVACHVCGYPTDDAEGLCSIICRTRMNRGHRVMVSAHIAGRTHRQIIGPGGTLGSRCVMRRTFTLDNQF